MQMESSLPPIPAKRYFTIGEVGELCGVKPHVLRYWEQEFTQLRPMKRRGNRRYYQHHEVLMIRRIRKLLYEQGFTISGARAKLQESSRDHRTALQPAPASTGQAMADADTVPAAIDEMAQALQAASPVPPAWAAQLARELKEIRDLLTPPETGGTNTL